MGIKSSLSKRKLIFGVGINDADYVTSRKRVKGVTVGPECPYYKRWFGMLSRCYSENFHERFPTYSGCSVCGDWLYFSKFKGWMENQDWQGKHLDKDILLQGNKVYSPETCIFIPSYINNLFLNSRAKRGDCKLGTSYDKSRKKYVVRCWDGQGEYTYLGGYTTDIEAHEEYCKYKYKIIKRIAECQEEPVKSALLKYKIID